MGAAAAAAVAIPTDHLLRKDSRYSTSPLEPTNSGTRWCTCAWGGSNLELLHLLPCDNGNEATCDEPEKKRRSRSRNGSFHFDNPNQSPDSDSDNLNQPRLVSSWPPHLLRLHLHNALVSVGALAARLHTAKSV